MLNFGYSHVGNKRAGRERKDTGWSRCIGTSGTNQRSIPLTLTLSPKGRGNKSRQAPFTQHRACHRMYAAAKPTCAVNIIRYMCFQETWFSTVASSSGLRTISHTT